MARLVPERDEVGGACGEGQEADDECAGGHQESGSHGDQCGGFSAIESEGLREVGACVQIRLDDGQTGICGGAGEGRIVEKVERARHLRELAVGRVEADFGDPPGPWFGGEDAPFEFGEERLKRFLVRGRSFDEEASSGAEPARDEAEAALELTGGEEVEDARSVDGAEGGGFEVEVAGEVAGLEGEAGVRRESGEMGRVEIVRDDVGSGVEGGEREESEGGADVEQGGVRVAAESASDLIDQAQ
jgi:hypothetical protein